MNKYDSTLFANLSTYSLIDPTTFMSDDNPTISTPIVNHNSDLVDEADNVSVKLDEHTIVDKKSLFEQLEASFSNGMLWEADLDSFTTNPEVEKSFFMEAVEHRNKAMTEKSLETILSEFDNWTGTPIDILSLYGDIDFGYNIFTDGFEMDVPVKIVGEADDLVFKVDAPWMKINTFKDVDLYPSRLNLKSVLSLLPITVNSNELKASFVDGEFRLEVPKNEVELGQKSKNS
ncbi:MAG TPA: hypothetical protein VFC73_06740 [Syntrophomonadaceae bacterium]|nr:hypothetical protein [Syntrophomonadaceae bacterium]